MYYSAAAQTGIIVVRAGLDEKKYVLHTSLLIYYSGFFHGALSGKFKETAEGCVALPHVASEPFDVFVDWIYSEKLPRKDMWKPNDAAYISTMYHAYALADMLLVLDMKEAILDVIFEGLETRYPRYDRVIYAFENLVDEDPLLQLLVDAQCINNGVERRQKEGNNELLERLPHKFLVRVMRKLNELSWMDDKPKKLERCWYVSKQPEA